MADTIVTNTPGITRSVDDGSAAIGWVVALLVVLALIVAGFALYRYNGSAAPSGGGANINVSLPSGSGSTGGSGATGGTTY